MTTGQATPSSTASCHVCAQTHHLSPGDSPGKPCSGTGVIRSFPWARANSRNSLVTRQQTVCKPRSLRSVLQHPSLYQPVSGLVEQVSKSPPRTLNEGSMDATKDFSRLTRWVSRSCGLTGGASPRKSRLQPCSLEGEAEWKPRLPHLEFPVVRP